MSSRVPDGPSSAGTSPVRLSWWPRAKRSGRAARAPRSSPHPRRLNDYDRSIMIEE